MKLHFNLMLKKIRDRDPTLEKAPGPNWPENPFVGFRRVCRFVRHTMDWIGTLIPSTIKTHFCYFYLLKNLINFFFSSSIFIEKKQIPQPPSPSFLGLSLFCVFLAEFSLLLLKLLCLVPLGDTSEIKQNIKCKNKFGFSSVVVLAKGKWICMVLLFTHRSKWTWMVEVSNKGNFLQCVERSLWTNA